MEFVADLHVHSHFSRATSRDLDLEHLFVQAQLKGVTVVGTGDFTHPGWFAELERTLRPAEEGLFALRPEVAAALGETVPSSCAAPVRFLLTTEISTIYKRGDRTRKVHHLICLPDLHSVSSLSRALSRIGNLASDGRPILGLDSRDLLELVLAASPRGVLIPAHIWTPWFSVLGSRSGFDAIEDCYRDLAGHIFAVETGLSSDPPMNWRLTALDRYALVSNSDAHSPRKLAREANLFSCELSYGAVFDALRGRCGFGGTIEFFPEEGKYHFDGHRACGVRLTPEETRGLEGRCPTCGKPVTLGVMYRVEALADGEEGRRPQGAAPFTSLVALAEVLGEVLGTGSGSRAVERSLTQLLHRLGPEIPILRSLPLEELRRAGGPVLAEGIARMRRGEVRIEGGYDGEFGRVHLLEERERAQLAGQHGLVGLSESPDVPRRVPPAPKTRPAPRAKAPASSIPARPEDHRAAELFAPRAGDPLRDLNPVQRRAVLHHGSPLSIVAGPGTGKTRVLTHRIAARVMQAFDPSRVLAVTFTHKAAAEMRSRLSVLLGEEPARPIQVCTFHALSLRVLNDARRAQGQASLRIIDEEERSRLLVSILPTARTRALASAGADISRASLHGKPCAFLEPYAVLLRHAGAMDLDLLVPEAVALLGQDSEWLARWRDRCQMVCVDEYQDLNLAQYELVRLLCPPGSDLCVIGDPDQAIYSFRGADPRYFLRFAEDYPGAARFSLERSYRSGRDLLAAAQDLVRHNPGRPPGCTSSELSGPSRISVIETASAAAEAELIVHHIERAVGGTTHFSLDSGRADGRPEESVAFADFAVLFRLRSQADALRQAFDRSGIPYVCSAGRNGTEEVTPILECVSRALATPADPEAARCLRGVEDLLPRAALFHLAETLCPANRLEDALRQMDRLSALLYDAGPGVAAWGPTLLGLAAASAEADALPDRAEAVSLLTLHASKGLEFKTVIIAGCEEGCLPHLVVSDEREAALAEERRLMYVGMTRARQSLVLTWARRRGRRTEQRPSRFLSEIAPGFVEWGKPEPLSPRRKKRQLTLL
jgi:DNA helicase-2/ATP-dependent DNA helicase PcrA